MLSHCIQTTGPSLDCNTWCALGVNHCRRAHGASHIEHCEHDPLQLVVLGHQLEQCHQELAQPPPLHPCLQLHLPHIDDGGQLLPLKSASSRDRWSQLLPMPSRRGPIWVLACDQHAALPPLHLPPYSVCGSSSHAVGNMMLIQPRHTGYWIFPCVCSCGQHNQCW